MVLWRGIHKNKYELKKKRREKQAVNLNRRECVSQARVFIFVYRCVSVMHLSSEVVSEFPPYC